MALKTTEKTQRGFLISGFKDSNGVECSIQQSSAIDVTDEQFKNPGTSFLWVGVDNPSPKILIPNVGWVDYPMSEEVQITSRMHLNRKQVKDLIETLESWLDTGEF